MNGNPKRVPGCDYLYERGGRFTVRVQVPRELKAALGKGEFKKSLGGDLTLAKRNYHTVVAGYLAEIDAARGTPTATGIDPPFSLKHPRSDEVDLACYAHFQRMAQNMRGNVAQPIGDDPRSLKTGLKAFG